jgi:outer membrane receptor protein involved in Fe transport
VAYNWRGKFLSGTNDSLGIVNPIYTAPYGQWDISASYQINKQLSVTLDGINVTNRTQRLYTRNIHELIYLAQTGPRYMFGVLYKF